MTPTLFHPDIFYGPYFSRRLGRSFGLNVIRVENKVCSFNCVYCECGETAALTVNPDPHLFYSTAEVLKAVKMALSKPRTVDTLTFSGCGEPTLHPEFLEIVLGIRRLIDEQRPMVKLALFTNGSRTCTEDVLKAYQLIDQVMVKLDAGDKATFSRINQPAPGFSFSDLTAGLRQLTSPVIQTCLIEGELANASGDALTAWAALVEELHPKELHIYSIDRTPWLASVDRVDSEKLQKIQAALQKRFTFPVLAFYRSKD